jgi:hypothetical protein
VEVASEHGHDLGRPARVATTAVTAAITAKATSNRVLILGSLWVSRIPTTTMGPNSPIVPMPTM